MRSCKDCGSDKKLIKEIDGITVDENGNLEANISLILCGDCGSVLVDTRP